MRTNESFEIATTRSSNPDGARDTLPVSTPPACRVLVVDDDDLVRARLSALLSASDFDVEVAATGMEALSVLNTSHCHVVLTDWQMPDMDGLKLCRHVRLRVQDGYTYVVMLTVRNSEVDMLTGFAAGADDYVVKGASISEILARVEIGRRISRGKDSPQSGDREMHPASYIDPVSSAHNIAYLAQHLPRELARSQRYGHTMAVLHCSIDNFGQITDRFGSKMGDVLLRAFVTRTISCIRHGDWLARTGDDDFMLILPETSAKGAHRVIQKLQQQFALHPLATPAGPIVFTANIDATVVDAKHDFESTLKIHSLLRTTDRRMVAHKLRNMHAPGTGSGVAAPQTAGSADENDELN